MPKRERTRLSWVPTWDGTTRGWAIKFINSNRWRCDSIHEFDDLLQDAYLTFVKVSEKYPRITEAKHFMALFKTAMWNQMHDRARYMRRKRLIHEETNDDPAILSMGTDYNAGPLLVCLNMEIPEEIRQALIIMETEPEKLREDINIRENMNMRLRRILGIDEHFDFAGTLQTLLTVEE